MAFRQEIRRIWFRCLRRRSQKAGRMGWDWFEALLERFPLPQPRITHPWAAQSGMTRVHLREEPGAGKPHARICEGESQMAELLDRDREPDGQAAAEQYARDRRYKISMPATK